MLSASDDNFHDVARNEEDWAETSWFSANIPELRVTMWFYVLFRPHLGVMSCGIYVFGPGVSEPWEATYYRQFWHMPIPNSVKGPCDFTLANGLTYATLEPLKSYQVEYEDGDEFSASLRYTALHPPHPLGVKDGVGHLDQLGRVQGHITLEGRRVLVDCVEMRDRTWGPRREGRQTTRLGYSYGGDLTGRGFHCSVRKDSEDRSHLMTGFFLSPGGDKEEIVTGERFVERDSKGRPLAIKLSLTSGEDKPVTVAGKVVGQMTLYTSPYVVFVSLVEWTLEDGSSVFGEDQDTWSHGRWQRFRRMNDYTSAGLTAK